MSTLRHSSPSDSPLEAQPDSPDPDPQPKVTTRPATKPMPNLKRPRRKESARSARHLAARRRARTVIGWAAPVWLGLTYLLVPGLRPGLRCFLGLGLLVALWFFLARTKTLAWQSLAALFAVGLPWGVVVALATRWPASTAGAAGAQTVVAAVAEQSLTVVPLLLIALLAPARVRGFSVSDWLLAGLVTGASVQAVEEFLRLDGVHQRYALGPFAGGSALLPDAGFAGRPVLAALIGATIGLAVAGWRHAVVPALSPAGRIAWRVLAVLAPPGCWWLAVSVQAGWNATVAAERWPSGLDGPVPGLLRLGWRLGQHGFGLGWLLLVTFLIALLVDAGRLRNAAELAEDPLPCPFAPTPAADQWAGRLTSWAGTRTSVPVRAAVWLIAAGCAGLAYAVRDLVVVLVAFARPGRRARWAAIARGCAAGVMVRTIRAEAIALIAGADTPVTRRVTRVTASAGLIVLLLAAFWLGPHWAGGLGNDFGSGRAGTAAPAADLVQSLVGFGPWWSALAPWAYPVIGIGMIALIAFSAGPLDLPGVVGWRTVWFAARSPAGLKPPDRIRDYLRLSSPTELMMDGVGAVLGLVPGRPGGPATGAQVQAAVHQFIDDPVAFIPERRAAARAVAVPPPAPVATTPIRPRPATELPALKLADGRLLSPLTEDDERLFVATLDDLARDLSGDVLRERREGAGPARPEVDYRARIYGDDERLISLRPEKWSDGQKPTYGMVGDVAYYDGRGVTWYVPDTLPETIRHKANLELDRRLIEFATVVYYPASPFRALEVTTNHPMVAQALEERMARLAIPGYVVLEP